MNNTDLNGRLMLEARMILEEAKRAFDSQALRSAETVLTEAQELTQRLLVARQ